MSTPNGATPHMVKLPSATPIDLDSDTPISVHDVWGRDMDSSSDESDEYGLVPHNRGYKLRKWKNRADFGGNKLRLYQPEVQAPDFNNFDKKQGVVKRKRRRAEHNLTDDDYSYSVVRVGEILGPLESTSDILHRPTLRRTFKSNQIESLAKSAMEFIEDNKQFNKVLARLSGILQQDDPQYMNLVWERKETVNGATNGEIDSPDLRSNHDTEEYFAHKQRADPVTDDREPVRRVQSMDMDGVASEEGDMDAKELLKEVRRLVQENLNCSNEYLSRLHAARDKLTKAQLQKEQLWKRLKLKAQEEQRKPGQQTSTARYGASSERVNGGNGNGR